LSWILSYLNQILHKLNNVLSAEAQNRQCCTALAQQVDVLQQQIDAMEGLVVAMDTKVAEMSMKVNAMATQVSLQTQQIAQQSRDLEKLLQVLMPPPAVAFRVTLHSM